jgi:predicted  nucleic acid-binding Zn-ribbon protein
MATNDVVQLLRREISKLEKQNKEFVQRSQTMLERKNNEIDVLKASLAAQENDIVRLWKVIREVSEQLNVSSKQPDVSSEQLKRLNELQTYTAKITELNAENATLRSQLITEEAVKSAKTTLEKKELQSSLPEIDTLKAAMTSVLTWLQQIGLL